MTVLTILSQKIIQSTYVDKIVDKDDDYLVSDSVDKDNTEDNHVSDKIDYLYVRDSTVLEIHQSFRPIMYNSLRGDIIVYMPYFYTKCYR